MGQEAKEGRPRVIEEPESGEERPGGPSWKATAGVQAGDSE